MKEGATPSTEAPSRVLAPAAVFRGVAALALLSVPLVLELDRDDAPLRAACFGLAGLCVSSVTLARRYAKTPPDGRTSTLAWLASLGVWAAALGYYLGPNSSFASVVALALVVVGAVGEGSTEATALRGRVTYGAIALGQGAVVWLVMAERLPDVSLTRILIPGHPGWHHTLAHGVLQLFYLGAFVTGRALQRRFATLLLELKAAVHEAAREEALLSEARGEYLRALNSAASPADAAPARHEASDATRRQASTLRNAPSQNLPNPGTLAALLRDRRLRRDELADLIRDVGGELAALHARGMPHLAVTPEELRRHASGAGWTLASPNAHHDPSHPDTLVFLAPERLRGRAPDQASDLYGFAACVYAAATGCLPFMEVLPPRRAEAVLSRMPLAPRSLADVPEALEACLRSALAKRREQRFESVEVFTRTLLHSLEREPSSAPPTEGARGSDLDEWTRPAPSSRSRRRSEGDEQEASDLVQREWRMAYDAKMRAFRWGLVAACATGAALLATIARERGPLLFALACLMAMAGTGLWSSRARGARSYWPWAFIGALFVGPAYSLGVSSGIVAALPIWLFAGGFFRRGAGDQRRGVLLAIVVAHGSAVALVLAGVLADAGNVAVRQPGAPWFEAALQEGLLMAVLAGAFAAGRAMEKTHALLAERMRTATRDAARHEVLLLAARSELDLARAHADGIFSGHRLGRYDVKRLLGRGGMGEVYEAEDARTGARIALKLVRADRVGEPDFLERLRAEASTLCRVDSPHVARVLGFSLGTATVPHLAMEFIEGRSLASVLEDSGTLTLETARELVADVTRGLSDLHAAGVVHCDVKPQNIVRTSEGRWKLVDLGVAQWLAPERSMSRSRGGTPAYMSPEQALHGVVDPRTDIYALSLVLYRALVGAPAFVGADPERLARRALREGPPHPGDDGGLPAQVLAVLRLGLCGLAKDRIATPEQLRLDFDAACEGRLAAPERERAAALPWAVRENSQPGEARPESVST